MSNNIMTTKESDPVTWHEERKKGIGGSDVAAILGFNKYKTPLDVYNEKLGLAEPFQGNAYTKAGLMLEDTIAKWYMDETGKKVIRDNKIRIHKDHDFLLANIDRIIIPENGEGRGVLEIKTAGAWAAKNWDDEPPMDYTLQIQHYLDVTGYIWGEFAVLIGGNDFRRYYVQRDQELIDLKNAKLIAFWNNNILAKVPPEPIKSEDIINYVSAQSGKYIEAAGATMEIISNLRKIKESIKELEKAEEEFTEQLKLAMNDAEAIKKDGIDLVTWKQSKESKRFESKAFQKDNPDLYEKYCVTVPGTRRFLIK